MLSITPCRTQISDRFPVASFVVRVPATNSFEVACATDPSLFRPDRQNERTKRNFFTTRFGGLLRAPAGEATIILPPEQLKNFTGSTRIYYALGAYGGDGGRAGRFTIRPDRLDQLPYVQLAQDFSGRSLSRLGRTTGRGSSAEYGGRDEVLTWGGDLFAAAATDSGIEHGGYDDDHGAGRYPRGVISSRVEALAEGSSPGGPTSYWSGDPDAYESDDYYDDSAGTEPGYGWEEEGTDSDAYRTEDYGAGAGYKPTGDYGSGEPEGYEEPGEPHGLGGSMDEPGGSEEPGEPLYGFGGSSVGEPEGCEEPGELYGHGGPAGAQEPVIVSPGGYESLEDLGEPPGYEDVSELLSNGLQLEPMPDGSGHGAPGGSSPTPGSAGLEPHPTTSGSYGSPDHESYGSASYGGANEGEPRHGAPNTSVSGTIVSSDDVRAVPQTPSRPSGILLSPQEMTRIVRPIFRLNGGMDAYGRVDADGRGLVWGMAGFNQRDGSLREVLHAALRRDQQWYGDTGESVFERVFGSQGTQHIRRYMDQSDPSAWMEQVGNVPLRDGSWTECFRKAGACHRPEVSGLALPPERDPFKVAQNEVAITRHLVPALPLARELGFNTDRSLAMLYDRVVDMGHHEAGRWFSESLSTVDPNQDIKGKLLHLVEAAEHQARPWSHRLRSIYENTPDLYDTIYRLDAA